MNANKLLYPSLIVAALSGCAVYPDGSPYYYPSYVSSVNQAFYNARHKAWERNQRKSAWQSKPFRPWKHDCCKYQKKITPVSSSGRSHFWKSHHGSHSKSWKAPKIR